MSTLAAQQSTFHGLSIKNDSRDENYQDIFEGFIRESPELNLINDLPTADDDIDQKPLIHSAAFGHPHMQLPLLQHHRLHNPVHPPSLAILKPHVLQQPSTTPTSSGGISPTLTWSGDPSPIDDTNSPTLNDSADLDGEEWNPPSSSPTSQLFAAPAAAAAAAAAKTSSSRRNSAGSARGRESALDGDGPITRASSHSHSRSRSSKRSASSSTSADGGDELTMSNLSIQNGTTSLSALMSGPPSPQASVAGASAHTPKPSAPARKKTRTNSSSRSSISSIDALISEAMGANNNAAAAGRLVPTGHRRNITSASLVPLDAPTQIRNYLTPSSTSKKEIPSAFVARRNKLKAKEAAVTKAPAPGPSTAGRKRTRDEAGGDEVDQLQDDDTPMSGGNSNHAASPSTTPSSPTNHPATAELASESSSLLSAIEAKRRQNTLAARRSRQRKLDYVRNLEELVSALTRERDSWKARAEGAEKILGYRPDEDEMDEA